VAAATARVMAGGGGGGGVAGPCVTPGGATGPWEAAHARGGQEASKVAACYAAATAGAVERRERGRATRGGKAGTLNRGGPTGGDDGVTLGP
jgi:hypothetical protein